MNKAIKITGLMCFLLLFSTPSFGQYQLKDFLPDTTKPFYPNCDTTTCLADSTFKALKSADFDSLKRLMPTLGVLSKAMDSLSVDDNLAEATIKHNYWIGNIQKDFKILQKECDLYNLNLKRMELRNYQITEAKHEYGEPFARIVLYCQRNNKYFAISFIALKLVDTWYLADDLELVYEKKPRNRKIPSKFKESIKVTPKSE